VLQCLSGLQCPAAVCRPPTVHDSASLWGTRLILQWRCDTVGSGRRRAGLCYLMCYWGRSLCDGNALFHLVFMQCILYFFEISFADICKDEPCTLHSLLVRLTLSPAMFAISSAYSGIEISSSPVKGCEGNCGLGKAYCPVYDPGSWLTTLTFLHLHHRPPFASLPPITRHHGKV